jgi:hypothetical protein
MARVLLDNEYLYVTSGVTGKFKVTAKERGLTRKANRAESLHFQRVIECLVDLGVAIEPESEAFENAVEMFAESLFGNGNARYQTYFNMQPHILANEVAGSV